MNESTPLPTLRTLGERVRHARRMRGMTQQELAGASHMDQTAISAIELGKVENPRNLDHLANALQVPEAWLKFGITDLDRFTDRQIQALDALADLPEADQALVIEFIARLKR